MPFAGLMLPILIVVNVLFVIIWIARKRHFAMLSLLAVAACLPQALKLVATNLSTPKIPTTKKTIKVLSYNVRDFDLYNWSDNVNSKQKIFETIRKQNADVISFQEFYNDTTKAFSTIKQLEALGYNYYFFTKELVLRNTDEWGIALFLNIQLKHREILSNKILKQDTAKSPLKDCTPILQ